MSVEISKLQRGMIPLIMLAFLACGGQANEQAEGGAAGGDEEISAESSALLSAGTVLDVTLDKELSVSEAQAGQPISATLVEPVRSDGRILVPAGATIRGEVTGVQQASESEQRVDAVKVHFSELYANGESYPVQAELIEANPVTKSETGTGEAIAKVGAGAAAGAILGRIVGGDDKGTLIGAALGAAAGTAIVLGTQEKKAVLPEGSRMRLRLVAPVRVTA